MSAFLLQKVSVFISFLLRLKIASLALFDLNFEIQKTNEKAKVVAIMEQYVRP